jgi:hypothetical protein
MTLWILEKQSKPLPPPTSCQKTNNDQSSKEYEDEWVEEWEDSDDDSSSDDSMPFFWINDFVLTPKKRTPCRNIKYQINQP